MENVEFWGKLGILDCDNSQDVLNGRNILKLKRLYQFMWKDYLHF